MICDRNFDTMKDSVELLKLLADIIEDCPFCLAKLKLKNNADVPQTPDRRHSTQRPDKRLYQNEYS
ncbi:MAG TPA: hypothetical protein VH796_04450 [Nitrososphaeraceae archaeon]